MASLSCQRMHARVLAQAASNDTNSDDSNSNNTKNQHRASDDVPASRKPESASLDLTDVMP